MFRKRCLIVPTKEEVLTSLSLELDKVLPQGKVYGNPKNVEQWGVVWTPPLEYSQKITKTVWCEEDSGLRNPKIYYYEDLWEEEPLCCSAKKREPVCDNETFVLELSLKELIGDVSKHNKFLEFESVEVAKDYAVSRKTKMKEMVKEEILKLFDEKFPAC
jgi:hypothetical protein